MQFTEGVGSVHSIHSFWRRSLTLLATAALLVTIPALSAGALAAVAPSSTTATAAVTATAAAKAATAAKGELGVRFTSGGASPQTGFDSAGLAKWAYAQAGVTLPATAAQQIKLGTSVSKNAMQPGDLLFFDADGSGTADWTGIYISAGQFAVAVNAGVVERNLRWSWYSSHLIGVRHLAGTAVQPPAPTPTPAPSTSFGQRVVTLARTYMGIPYRFGATGPSAYDCSGFTQAVFRRVGVQLPRTAAQQSRVGQFVSKANLQPGDLVFFQHTYTTDRVDHVGIYIGGGKFIDAWPGVGVTISDLNRPYFTSHYWGARRVG
ncbi:MAG: C40 family peptidase [Symbiobacteriia bacterium]